MVVLSEILIFIGVIAVFIVVLKMRKSKNKTNEDTFSVGAVKETAPQTEKVVEDVIGLGEASSKLLISKHPDIASALEESGLLDINEKYPNAYYIDDDDMYRKIMTLGFATALTKEDLLGTANEEMGYENCLRIDEEKLIERLS